MEALWPCANFEPIYQFIYYCCCFGQSGSSLQLLKKEIELNFSAKKTVTFKTFTLTRMTSEASSIMRELAERSLIGTYLYS